MLALLALLEVQNTDSISKGMIAMQPTTAPAFPTLDDPTLQRITAYARECLSAIPHATKMNTAFPFRDRYAHSLRVMGWCQRLLEGIPAQRDIVLAAAALHDVGYAVSAADHALHGQRMAEGFLREMGMEEGALLNIADLIGRHSDKHLNPLRMSNELMVLQDADCLDEIGAVTVLWDGLAEGAEPEQSYVKAYHRIAQSYRNLTGRNRRMKTEIAQELYQQRLGFLGDFLRELEFELFL